MIPWILTGVLMLSVLGGGTYWMLRVPGVYRPGLYKSPKEPPPPSLPERLRSHLRVLSREIGERNLRRPDSLRRAAEYIESRLRSRYRAVRSQRFTVGDSTVRNLEVACSPGKQRGVLIVGAHYDTVPGCPGANDNATGVAALLELARRFSARNPPREVRFVAFVNEEPPYFGTKRMGSLRYARRCTERGERIVGMCSLETLGCYSSEPASQRYPFPFGWIYPDRAEFLGFVTNLRGRSLMHRLLGAFRERAVLPAQGVAAPAFVPGVGWSDHWSFWKQGYPAVMVTDTALYRYPQYHRPEDTLEHVDVEHFSRAVEGIDHALRELAAD